MTTVDGRNPTGECIFLLSRDRCVTNPQGVWRCVRSLGGQVILKGVTQKCAGSIRDMYMFYLYVTIYICILHSFLIWIDIDEGKNNPQIMQYTWNIWWFSFWSVVFYLFGGDQNSIFHACLDDGARCFQSHLVSNLLFGNCLHLVHLIQIKTSAVNYSYQAPETL